MPWARFDDRFPSNRKVRLLSDGAFRLYVSSICWSAENLTDGVIKTAELRLVADVRATRTRAKELVEAGLFEVVEGVGWKIHDYHEYNPTAEQVHADRAQRTARQQRWRKKKQSDAPDPEPPDGNADVDASTNASHDASRNGVRDAAPSRPVPTRTPNGVDVGGDSAGSGAPDLDHLTPAPIEIDGFQLTDAMRRWAHATHPSVDIEHSTAQFVSHYRSTGDRRRSWPDAWQKWIRDDAKRAPATGHPGPTQGAFLVPLPGGNTHTLSRPSVTDQRVRDGLALAARLQAREDAQAQRESS